MAESVTAELFDKKEIDENYLPRNGEVIAYYHYSRDLASYHSKKSLTISAVADKVIEIWKKTDMHIITKKHVRKKIEVALKAYRTIKRKIVVGTYASHELQFLHDVFNALPLQCDCEDIHCCDCSFKATLGEQHYTFFVDQATERKYKINEYYDEEIMNQTINSKISDLSIRSTSPPRPSSPLPAENVLKTPRNDKTKNENGSSKESDDDDGHSDDPDYKPDVKTIIPKFVKLPNSIYELNIEGVVLESMRYNTSVRETAAIVNRTLEGIGAITDDAKGLVVTPAFIQRRTNLLGRELTSSWKKKTQDNELQCFFFDGVCMHNKMPIRKNNRNVPDNSVLYDNIAIVKEPNSRFLGFVTTADSAAESIYHKLLEFFIENEISLSNLIAIGCDGAPTNVGVDNGIIRKFEESLQRPLHYIVCLLHLIELILKAIICYYYGENINKFKILGKINDELNNCHNFPVRNFTQMELQNMPDMDSFDLSLLNLDQQYLYKMGKALNDGLVDEHLANRRPGEISSARWTITASRFLRLYASTETPPYKMIAVVQFIQRVYIPIMFRIKCNPEWKYGAQHLFNILMFSQHLDKKSFNVVKERVEFNSFFAHSENILLCMLSDEDKLVRRAAYNVIVSIRARNDQQLRVFKKPKINVKFLENVSQPSDVYIHYSELINWNTTETYEPPFTQKLPIQILKAQIDSGEDIIKIPSLPSHSQSTEFYVQAVKSVVTKYVGPESQNRRVIGKIVGRKLNEEFNLHSTKDNYKLAYETNLI